MAFGGDGEGVEVAVDRGGELQCGVGVVAGDAGGGLGGFVAGEDGFEDVGGGRWGVLFGADDVVYFAVADYLEVEVVAAAAAGDGGLGELAGFLAGEQGVAGVGGDALGGVDGGGVAEFDRRVHVGGG